MRKLLLLITCSLLWLTSVNAATINTSLYDTVKDGETEIILSAEDDLFVITRYYLKKLMDDGDEAYDYYILETGTYFSKGGDSLEVTHLTNNAAIAFETLDYNVARIMASENKFFNFFSDLNNFTKVSCRKIDSSENIWNYSRNFYAMNRYYDNTYTFTNITAFRVKENKEVRVDFKINGSFIDGPFEEYHHTIVYDDVKERLNIEYNSEDQVEDGNIQDRNEEQNKTEEE